MYVQHRSCTTQVVPGETWCRFVIVYTGCTLPHNIPSKVCTGLYFNVIYTGYTVDVRFTDGKSACIPSKNHNTCGTCLQVYMYYNPIERHTNAGDYIVPFLSVPRPML